MNFKTCFIAVFLVITIFANYTLAEDTVPLDIQAELLLNALSYDKNLEKGDGSQFDIAIVYFSWFNASKAEGATFSQILRGFKDRKISGRSFNVIRLSYNGDYGLKEKIAGKNVKVLLICGEEESMIRDITQLTQSMKILSFISNAKLLNSGNVTMAVGLKENKPKIFLNLSSAKAEGADFSAKFLRVANIVDENGE